MVKAGTIDKTAYDALPPVNGTSVTPTIGADGEGRGVPVLELGQGRRLPHAWASYSTGPRRGAAGAAAAPLPAGVFLLSPTITVVVGAFQEDGRFSLANITTLYTQTLLTVLWKSVVLSAVSAIVGAVLGSFLAYLDRDAATRRAWCGAR